MNKERLLATFLDLVQIDSVSYYEAAVAAYCKQALEQAGCAVWVDETQAATGSNTGNVIATLPGTRPGKLYLSAHLDTVVPGEGIRPVIIDGVVRPEGPTILGADDKAGVAAIIELVRSLAEADEPHPEIGVLFSVCEEIGLLGSLALDSRGFDGEPCLVLDGDGKPGVVAVGAPFHFKFTAAFTGKAAHAGIEPEKGISAIALAAEAVCNMELGRLDEHTTVNVGSISGGSADNIVPGICRLTGEFRVMEKDKAVQVQAQLESAMQGATTRLGGTVATTWVMNYAGYRVAEDDPLVVLVLEQAQELGLETETMLSGGGSDANIYTAEGLKALVLGTGMSGVHGLGEHLAVSDLEDLALLVISVAYAFEQ